MKNNSINLKFIEPMTRIFVKNVELSKQFYVENFGFVETYRNVTNDVLDHIELKLENFALAISSISAAKNIHNLEVGIEPLGIPRTELIFWTEDVDKAYELLLANGASGVKEPHDFRKMRPAWISDPDGHLIEIVQKRK